MACSPQTLNNTTYPQAILDINLSGGSTPGMPGEDCQLQVDFTASGNLNNAMPIVDDIVSIGPISLRDGVPVAQNTSVSSNGASSVTIQLSTLEVNSGDGGTVIQLTDAPPISGATVALDGQSVTYMPPNPLAAFSQAIDYELVDVNGTRSLEQTITVSSSSAAPTNLSVARVANLATGATQLDLDWDAPSPSITVDSYRIYRKQSSGSVFSLIATVSSGTSDFNNTEFNNTGLTSNISYDYRVAAVVGGNESDFADDTESTPVSFFASVDSEFNTCRSCHDGTDATATSQFSLSGTALSQYNNIRSEMSAGNIPCKPVNSGVTCGDGSTVHSGGTYWSPAPAIFTAWDNDGEYQ